MNSQIREITMLVILEKLLPGRCGPCARALARDEFAGALMDCDLSLLKVTGFRS